MYIVYTTHIRACMLHVYTYMYIHVCIYTIIEWGVYDAENVIFLCKNGINLSMKCIK